MGRLLGSMGRILGLVRPIIDTIFDLIYPEAEDPGMVWKILWLLLMAILIVGAVHAPR